MSYDLVIIGRGFAGLMVLKQAVEAQKKVCVIYKDNGASQYFSGAFDVIDPRWQNKKLSGANYPDIKTALQDFTRAHPSHIYDFLFHQPMGLDPYHEELKSFFDFYKLPVLCDDRMVSVFGSTGRLKPTGFCLKTHGVKAAELALFKKAVVIDFGVFADYPAGIIQKNLMPLFAEVRLVRLTESPLPNSTSPLVTYNHAMDAEAAVLHGLQLALKHEVKGDEIVFIPPVLGFKNWLANHTQLEAFLKTRVVELLSALPSIAGLRASRIIDDAVQALEAQNQVTFIKGRVANFISKQNIIERVLVDCGESSHDEVAGNEFVLATGKFTGGGISRADTFNETVFDLPLYLGDEPVRHCQDVTKFISPQPQTGQALFSIGLRLNREANPCDIKTGRPLFTNLRACGHILTGFDYTREHCGFGVSMASALLALQYP